MQRESEHRARALPILCDPRSQFIFDLKDCIQESQEHGDFIIIGMDLNDQVQRYDCTHLFGNCI